MLGMTLRRRAIVAGAVLGAVSMGTSAGCSSPTNSSPAPTGIGCLDILKCIVDCPAADDACPDACAAKGTAEAKSAIQSLGTCVDTESCTTGPCVTDKCAAPLKQCVDATKIEPSQPPPLVGSAPPGSIPPDLVGVWAATTDGNGGKLTLNSDGSGSWFHGFSYLGYPEGSSTQCLVVGSTTLSGNIVVEEQPSNATPGSPPYGKITVYATSVVKSFRNCSGPLQNKSEPPATVQLEWYRDYDGSGYQNLADPNLIFIIESDCAAKYPGQPVPIAMYCTTRVRRQ